MYSTLFTIVLLLLYFWYMTSFPNPSNFSKPSQNPLEPPPNPLTHLLKSVPQVNKFQFFINSQIVWKENLPDTYEVTNNQFIKQDACHQMPDDALVSATGHTLYELMQQDRLISHQTFTFDANASVMLQDKNTFYFSCKQGRIHQLHMCPPGQYFRVSACHIIDQCAGQKDGKTFPDPLDTSRFYECHQEKAYLKVCPPDTYFAYNKCFNAMLVGLYCYAVEKPKILDIKTLVVCRKGKIEYEVCPPGFRYFDIPKCEPEACVGQADGQRVPLPHQQMGPLAFSPGYMECLNEKVVSTHTCPQKWDSHLSSGDNLTHLPQVFDGQKCTIPEFCVNVTSKDPDVLVPVHEFTKHVRNWIFSDTMDRMKGYKCEGSKRKRVLVEDGKMIHAKRLKAESICYNSTEHVMVPHTNNAYFDCQSKTLQACPVNQFFDGHECRDSMPHAFEYQNLQLFQMDSLRDDNWMVPWDYAKRNSSIEPCRAPETEYLATYNLCIHPECVLYPWLSQTPFQVALPNGGVCTFNDQTRYIQKKDSDDKYLYWAQRRVDQVDPQEKCIPGQNIQSGHFFFDKTIFATCSDQQPFVFCPSSSTKGITFVKGRYWACNPSDMKGTVPPNTKVTFHKNEVEKLLPLSNQVTEAIINGKKTLILPQGHVEMDRFTMETLGEPVAVKYERRITHPPEVTWPEEVSDPGSAYLIKVKNFTRKSVDIPRYGIKDSVVGFHLT